MAHIAATSVWRGLDIRYEFQGTPTSNVQWFISANGYGAGPTYPRLPLPRWYNRAKILFHFTQCNLSGGIGSPLLSFDLYQNGSAIVTNWIQFGNGSSGVFQSSIQAVSFDVGDDIAIFMRGPGASFSMPIAFGAFLTLDISQ